MGTVNDTINSGLLFQDDWITSIEKCNIDEDVIDLSFEEIELLVPLLKKSKTDNNINIHINKIYTDAVYEDTKNLLTDLGIQVVAKVEYVRIEDSLATEILLQKYGSYSDDGEHFTKAGLQKIPTVMGSAFVSSRVINGNFWKYIGTTKSLTDNSGIFQNCRLLKTLIFPDSVTSVGSNGTSQNFWHCPSLKRIDFNNVTTITNYPFGTWCSNLEELVFRKMSKYGTNISGSTQNNQNTFAPIKKIIIEDLALYLQMNPGTSSTPLLHCPSARGIASLYWINDEETPITHIEVPNTITNICECALYGIKTIESVFIPSTIATIKHGAFGQCTGITSVSTDSVLNWFKIKFTSVSSNPTYWAHNLKLRTQDSEDFITTVDLSLLDQDKTITGIADCVCTNNEYITDVKLHDAITSIGIQSFEGCTSLTNLDLNGAQLSSIGASAFSGCTSLTDLNLNVSQLSSIGNNAFYGCTSLDNLNFSNCTFTTLTDGQFYNCTSLKNIILPETLTTISQSTATAPGVFSNCTSLEYINLRNVTSLTAAFSANMVGMFQNCNNLKTVDAPYLETAGSAAFMGCVNLTTVNAPKLTTASVRSFSGCTSLTTINLPELTTIGGSNASYTDGAFTNCTSLTSIYTPKLKTVGIYGFRGCTNLHLNSENIQNATSFSYSAFYGCTFDKMTYTSDEMTSITSYYNNVGVFSSSKGYLHLNKVETIAMGTLQGNSFSTLILPKSLTTITNNNTTTSQIGQVLGGTKRFIYEDGGKNLVTFANTGYFVGYGTTTRTIKDFPSNLNLTGTASKWCYNSNGKLANAVFRMSTPPKVTDYSSNKPTNIFVPSEFYSAYTTAWGTTGIYTIGSDKWVEVMHTIATECEFEAPDGFDWADEFADYDIIGARKPEKDANGVYKTYGHGNLD